MKRTIIFLFGATLISIVACNKKAAEDMQPTSSSTFNPSALAKHGSDDTTVVDDRGGHGNDDSTDHQGGNNSGSGNAEIIKDFSLAGASQLKATKPDSMRIELRNPAPATGYTLTFTSSDAAVQPPVSLTMAAGTTKKYAVLRSTAVKSSRNVTITVKVGSQSRSETIKLVP